MRTLDDVAAERLSELLGVEVALATSLDELPGVVALS